MSEDRFNSDDLSLTLARFSKKQRNIEYDESKLKRKAPEPLAFSSATEDCGSAILKGVATLLTETPQQKKRDEEWAQLKKQEEENRCNSYYYYK